MKVLRKPRLNRTVVSVAVDISTSLLRVLSAIDMVPLSFAVDPSLVGQSLVGQSLVDQSLALRW
jgi:hypothetical protein